MKLFNKVSSKSPTNASNNSETKKYLIKQILNDVLDDSLSKAILKLFTSSSGFVRVFWCLGLLFSTGLCSYFLIESILVFFTYQLRTTVRTYVEVTSQFPKITFCNKNIFTTKYAYDMAQGASFNDFQYKVNLNFYFEFKGKLMFCRSFESIFVFGSFSIKIMDFSFFSFCFCQLSCFVKKNVHNLKSYFKLYFKFRLLECHVNLQ